MRIIFGLSKPREVIIFANTEEYLCISKTLSSGSGQYDLQTDGTQRGNTILANELKIEKNNSKLITVHVDIESKKVFIRGNENVLPALAFIVKEFTIDYSSGQHIHLDYADSPEVFSLQSDFLILELVE